ncbi:2-oxoacid:ferredoxin oxidoreductase subunit beta [Aliikangiella marina]|uniref:2-oxoacid:ferredoxin oxidoreductase subunit beta n=1 Tax=Aliikangiella marina TaxID=1712262 RepID=A0A545T0Z1_9GAMM|nr:2-oxoacid:ferredoxin oxidoreductase subunit beta [Aliikangiella marina]TQV70882.1 2-oxoacid:ferredoxin oxidoreductase subunit beta [Aliikangiella marina]
MSYLRSSFRHPHAQKNKLGYTQANYEGALSTLCAGCGHDSISNSIINACFELSLEPHKIAKMSGIGCSSKTPAYFLSNSHGFNSVHGRMPSVTTGANMGNRDLTYIGVSGDGDTASIGMGQFMHLVRRNLNMVYIVMNNGVYGLTKGQDSATADLGSASKKGVPNMYEPMDLCELAISLGSGYVARSFSGDKDQLVPLIKGAIKHNGFALIDCISPCVTFNNNPQSTKSYEWVRDHKEATGKFDLVPEAAEIQVQNPNELTESIQLHDGTTLNLHRQPDSLDITCRESVLSALEEAKQNQQVLTGLLHLNTNSKDTHDIINTSSKPLNQMSESELCPGSDILESINASLR